MKLLFVLLALPLIAYGQTTDEIVKKAIEDTKNPPKVVDKGDASIDAVIEKVIRKANGDIETHYILPNKLRVGIRESSDEEKVTGPRKGIALNGGPRTKACECIDCDCDGCQCKPGYKCDNDGCVRRKANAANTLVKDAPEYVDVVINGKRYKLTGHSVATANTAIAELGVPVFVDPNSPVGSEEIIEPPSWYVGAWTRNIKKTFPPQVQPTPPLTPPQVYSQPYVNVYNQPGNPVRAGGGSSFPTMRPTPVQSVGPNNMWSPTSMPMGRTITYAPAVARGGSTRGGCTTSG